MIITEDFLRTLKLWPSEEHTSTISTITAIYDVGCFFGAISAMYFGERLGRKNGILLGTSIMTVGAILQASAFSVPQMIVARIISGIGNGIVCHGSWSSFYQNGYASPLTELEYLYRPHLADRNLTSQMEGGFGCYRDDT